MRPNNKKLARLLLPVVVGAACMMAASIVVYATVALAHTTPQVGDIVAFIPSATEPADEVTRLLVQRQDRPDCILDLKVVRRSGGSLVIESELDDRAGAFGVHWAGGRTSTGVGDCGGNADLIIDHQDLDILALAAGGYGVGPKLVSSLLNDMRN